jgi:AAA domain
MNFDQAAWEEEVEQEAARRANRRTTPLTEGNAAGQIAKVDVPPIIAAPFMWPDPATIPPRQRLFGQHYIRKNIGCTIGGGGRAKTTLGLLEAVSMACGRNLLTGEMLREPLRAWFLNGEEDQTELDRRVVAICQCYSITKADCGGRLFVQSVRDKPMRLATLVRNVPILNHELLDQFEAEIRVKKIDVFMLDPLISFHSVTESINEHMDLLLKEGLGGIASRTNSAGEIFHHPGKAKPGQAETTVEDARGASAIIWAVRSARVLNFMTPEEATKLGIGDDTRRMHIRVTNGKANMGPLGKATWFKLKVENLANGDEIACASPWTPPNPFQGVTTTDMHKCRTLAQTGAYRVDSRSEDWIGYAVAKVLNINVAYSDENDPQDIARIKQILSIWYKNKVLVTENRKDKNRKDRTFIIPGPWQPDATTAASDEYDPDDSAA